MTLGDIHPIAANLFVIEGHHPHRLWEDPDIPSIVVYRKGSTLYLLDTGVGPLQRTSILHLADQLGPVDEVVLVNSHGHLDHLGNNDVVDDIPATTKRHYFPRAARDALDTVGFFSSMYRRGLRYFDYLDGLRLDTESMSSLLRAVGADPALNPADVSALGTLLVSSGITPAIGQFIPSLLVDVLVRTYPTTQPRIESMRDLEELGPAAEIVIGDTTWTGWTLGDGAVQVLQSAGHSAGGCVFYIPEHAFLMLADETTSAPIWADSIPANTVSTAQRAVTMMRTGHLTQICAGHKPMLPQRGAEATQILTALIASADEFKAAVDDVLARRETGITIDELFMELTTAAQPGSLIDLMHAYQFPVFGTFLKLTLLNHCLLMNLRQGVDGRGRPTFRAD